MASAPGRLSAVECITYWPWHYLGRAMTETMSGQGAGGARWEQPPIEDYALGTAVHVWRANVGPAARQSRPTSDFLSDEEHVRAARVRRPADRERHLAAHSALPIILARYLNMLPEQIRYLSSTPGKP